MNPRYRKATRLRSRHYRRGHTYWCHCPEPQQQVLLTFRRWRTSRRPLPTGTLRPGMTLAANRTSKPERVVGPTEQEG